MSCPNATAPININLTPYTTCELKCDYSFSYSITPTLVLTNNGNNLLIQPENSYDTPVVYNDSRYQVHEIRLYYASLHTYAGENASAELIIHHTNIQGGNDLIVCIPVMSDDSSNSNSSQLFSTIISQVANQANSSNQQTVASITTFTLNQMVPMTPFYTYSGTLLYAPCNGQYDYIVFSKNNGGYITMSSSTYSTFTQIISQNTDYTVVGIDESSVFYNASGPSNGASTSSENSDEIYIDCQPTGANGTSLVPVNKTIEPGLVVGLSDFINNPYIKSLLPVFVIFIVVKIAGSILNSISNVSSGGSNAPTSGGGRGRSRK